MLREMSRQRSKSRLLLCFEDSGGIGGPGGNYNTSSPCVSPNSDLCT